MKGRAVRMRIAITLLGFSAMVAVLALRAAELTLLRGDELRARAARQQTRRVALAPRRGPIVDRHGEALALTRESVSVFVRPRELRASAEEIGRLAALLDLDPALVARRAASQVPFAWLKRQVSLERWEAVERLHLTGVGAEPARERVYPLGPVAGHVIGFIGIDGQGLEGIERWLDRDLRGEADALDVGRDARGRQLLLGDGWWPLPLVGARVELTIDSRLQHVVESELQAAVDEFAAKAGAAIVMDPKSGEILAMANVPSFDPNHFRSATPQQWRNRAVTDLYEPGSTMKAMLAATALERGAVSADEKIDCEHGRFRVSNRTIRDHHPYDVLPFADVIAFSSNIGCAKIGARLGRDVLGAALRSFGFARPTGIDLPGEAAGLVRPENAWREIDVATASFGQGIAVTPIQLVRAFAAIANGGRLLRPHVVRRVVASGGDVLQDSTPVRERRVMSPETARLVTQLLVRVVEEGTGTSARVDGFTVAGKTGTSQKVDPATGRYHPTDRVASFAGFLPAEDPALAILVVVDTPTRGSHYGGVVAAPVFRRIAEQGLALLGVLPEGESLRERREARRAGLLPAAYAPAATGEAAAGGAAAYEDVEGMTPSFLGLSMRDATVKAYLRGWRVRAEGSGYVVAQQPPPGAPLAGEILQLAFGSRVP